MALATPFLSYRPRALSLFPSFSSSAPDKPQTLTLTLKSSPLSSTRRHLRCAPSPSPSPATLITHEDLNEPDWSFVEPPSGHPTQQQLRRVVTSAALPPFSRVLVSLPTPRFVDELLDPEQGVEPPQLVAAYHESLVVLSNVKEAHDEVRCFQGDVTDVPLKFAPYDAVFVCYFPGMGMPIGELLRTHAPLCSSGSRVVIFVEQGRESIEVHKQQFPGRVTTDLPDLGTLTNAAASNGFEVIEFVDEPTFYVAVLSLR